MSKNVPGYVLEFILSSLRKVTELSHKSFKTLSDRQSEQFLLAVFEPLFRFDLRI